MKEVKIPSGVKTCFNNIIIQEAMTPKITSFLNDDLIDIKYEF